MALPSATEWIESGGKVGRYWLRLFYTFCYQQQVISVVRFFRTTHFFLLAAFSLNHSSTCTLVTASLRVKPSLLEPSLKSKEYLMQKSG